jgi:hypothetical protein
MWKWYIPGIGIYQPDAKGDHYLCCTGGGAQRGIRHDRILDPISNVMRTAGHITRTTGLSEILQNRNLETGKRLVPDALCVGWSDDGTDCCVDLSVTHPCARTWIQRAAGAPLHAAAEREKKKRNKYNQACASQGLSFAPFVLETYGALGAEAQKIVKAAVAKIALKLPDDHFSRLAIRSWTATSFRAHFLQRISISLQRGNSKAIRLRALRDFKLVGRQDSRIESPPRDSLAHE